MNKHNQTPGHIMNAAGQVCMQYAEKLTPLRREVLKIIANHGSPVKAYDIIEHLRENGRRATPASVYRTLDFLLKCGLAHRVNSLNAYIPCSGGHCNQTLLMLVCPQCQKTEEISDEVLHSVLQKRFTELGMPINDSNIEIQSSCSACRTKDSGDKN